MKSAVENLTATRVKLNVEVPFEELKPSIDAAYKTVASQIQVPGFRKGKVPSKLIDQRVGRGYVLETGTVALEGPAAHLKADEQVRKLRSPS